MGQKLRELREGTGLERHQFAARIGVSTSTLKNAENGQQRLGARTMCDAERVATAEQETWQNAASQIVAGKTSPPLDLASVGRESIPEAVVVKAIKEAENPDIQAAAKALARATDMSYEEALGAVIARKLNT